MQLPSMPQRRVPYRRWGNAKTFSKHPRGGLEVFGSNDAHSILGKLGFCPSTNVHCARHWFQVVWVYARSISTKVIQLKPGWNRAISFLVVQPVDESRDATNTALRVPTVVLEALPDPAWPSGISPIFDNVYRVFAPIVAFDKAKRFTGKKASRAITNAGDRRDASAPTHTQARWVGRRTIRSSRKTKTLLRTVYTVFRCVGVKRLRALWTRIRSDRHELTSNHRSKCDYQYTKPWTTNATEDIA